MVKIVNTKIGEFSIAEAFAVGVSKAFAEKILANTFVGNGTYKSGLMKLLGGWALGKFIKGKVSTVIATGLAVDGVEDILFNLLGGSADNTAGYAEVI